MKNRIRVIIMTFLLCVCIFIPTVSLNAADENTSSSTDACTVVEYTDLEEVRDYLAGKNAYPTKEGYLFAGWYTKDIRTETDDTVAAKYAIKSEIPENIDTVYALFVPTNVFDVKAQLSGDLLDGLEGNSKGSIRFVTTVNSLLYKEVGFEVSYVNGKGAKKNAVSSSNKVYEKLYAVGSTTDEYKENDKEYLPTEFCTASKYFKACNLNNVPASDFNVPFSVKPFWVTLDGSKVYGETFIKSIDDYFLAEDVYLSTAASVKDKNNAEGYGFSEAKPCVSLNYALGLIKNQGTVHIVDTYSTTADFVWNEHNKTVNITGGTIDFTTLPEVTLKAATDTTEANITNALDMRDSVTFTDTTLVFTGSDEQHIYANGNTLEIDSTVKWSNTDAYIRVYGGSHNTALTSDTNLILGAGQYTRVFGAGNFSALTGNVNIVLSGSINPNIDYAGHSNTYTVFGGGQNSSANVEGDVNIVVADENVLFNRIYGGGHNRSVTGNVNIQFAGKSMGIYGGGLGGTITGDTYITMTGGWVEQIFGGCEDKSMTGNTNIDVQGGTIKRRIYGGCYNDYKDYGSIWPNYQWEADNKEIEPYQVTGHTNVSITPNTTLELDFMSDGIKVDNSIYAISRYKELLKGEWGAFILNEDYYKKLSNDSVFGYSGAVYSDAFATRTHHYLITTNGNNADGSLGTVSSQSDYIRIKPCRGYSAVVKVEGTQEFYTESDAVFKLPELTETTEEKKITVTFSTIDPNVDKSSYEARIDGAYYESFVEAVAVAPILDSKDTVTVTLLKDIEMTAQMDIESKIAIQNESEKDITVYRGAGLAETDMFNVTSTGTLTLAGVGDRDSLVLDGRTIENVAVESSGSLINNAGKLKIKNTTLQYANKTTGNGAAVESLGSSIEVENSMFVNNQTTAGFAGGIYVGTGKMSLKNVEFIGNSGVDGGAIRTNGISTVVSIEKCKFGSKDNGNIDKNDGGGAIYNNKASINIADTEFSYNKTTGSGGAIYNNGGVVVVKNSKFTYNTADVNGGAIQNSTTAGELILNANNDNGVNSLATFMSNESYGTTDSRYGGGAVSMTNGTVEITGYRFENNIAKLNGGAIRKTSGTLTISNATFTNNSTTGESGYGGAIFVNAKTAKITAATFVNNSTNGKNAHGGALYIASETAINENVGRVNTFTDNNVNGSGSKGNHIYVNITSSQLIESPETSIGTGTGTDENIGFGE